MLFVGLQEQRRIVYVGGIPNNFSKYDLVDKFKKFGQIENVSVHPQEFKYVLNLSNCKL